MDLPRAGRLALYVGVEVIDFANGHSVVLAWSASFDNGINWVPGEATVLTKPDGTVVDVTRWLVAGPDAPTDIEADAVLATTVEPQIKSVDGDEILIETLAPITVV